ncbi:PREDICTED: uncharacterized protein LOC109184754 [Ipomoea nil]|uniref:uncharacterized protein LOC109184754 n=1 Tax=Ipomoea nil TaxID=35883 RepID=UPI000901DD86|nr:PREDICTED: uncharacterized protein LOC109184754 [Ipomoea nil]
MSKAYDRVQWRFLEAVLVKMGFARHWVNVLLESVSAVRYHILYERLGPIVPECGLRQGDPLSPYLFLFVVEGLSVLIEEEMSMGRLHGARVARGAPAISHLLFADDCFLFLRANIQESERMRCILDTYATASGQRINYDKSAICFSANVSQPIRDGVVQILGVAEGNTTGKYLGLPSLVGRKKREILGYLKERILTRVRSWNSKFLSRAGREVLLKNVIQAMPSYAMMVFLLPLSLCKEIETLMNGYWWTGSVGSRKGIRWRAWEGLAQPKAAGGLGFRKLHEMNLALLGKQAWRLVTRPQSLVARVYKARYFPRCAFFDSKEGSNPSYIWRGLLAVKDVVREGCRRSIGNGLDTTIGNHAWLLCENNPFITAALAEEVALAPVASLLNNQDSWYWYWDQKGAYTVKSCYKRLNGAVSNQRPWARIWNLSVPPKDGRQECKTYVRHMYRGASWEVKAEFGCYCSFAGRCNGLWLGAMGDDGSFLAAKNVRVSGTYSIKEAEAMSLREALSWLKNTGMGGVVVEIDSQLVYNAILSSSFNSAYGFLVDDIKELASAIGDVEFRCVRRSANCAAHVVAREAFSVAGCGEWFNIPPDFLVSCLANDLIQ